MIDEFEFNKEEYKLSVDNIKLSDAQKNDIKQKMRAERRKMKTADTNKGEKFLRTYYNIGTKTAAAVLAVALLAGAMFFFHGTGDSKNSFSITANAAEVNVADSAVKIASGEMSNGFSMLTFDDDSVKPYYNKLGKQDLFTQFKFTDFRILGDNIRSVTFETTKNFSYFGINSDNENNEFTSMDTLTHSQYTQAEFDEHGDGIYGKFCDGFTFDNKQNLTEINLSNVINLIVESNWNDEEIAEWMAVVSDCFDKTTEHKIDLYYQTGGVGGGEIPEEIIEVENLADEYMAKICDKLIDGAEIIITVEFSDGSSQTQTLLLGFNKGESESFLTAKAI